MHEFKKVLQFDNVNCPISACNHCLSQLCFVSAAHVDVIVCQQDYTPQAALENFKTIAAAAE